MLKIRPLKQQRLTNCGPAVLRMVLRYYGIRVPEQTLRQQLGVTSKRGAPHEALVRVARKYGFRVVAQEGARTLADIRAFVQCGHPVIVGWYSDREQPAGSHYCVAVDARGQQLFLLDPGDGKRIMIPWSHFRALWFDFDGDLAFHKPPLKVHWRWMMAVLPQNVKRKT